MMKELSDRFYDSHDAGPEWATPRWIWGPLAEALDGFDLDPATACEPEPIAETCYTLDTTLPTRGNPYQAGDGLSVPWFGDVWVNPPYGRKFNDRWAKRIVEQAERESVDSVTALLPAATSTARWHKGVYPLKEADLFTFIEGRVQFIGAGENGGSFASVILTFGDVPDAYTSALRNLGMVLERRKL